MKNSGLKLAARYSYRPFALGFCGPQENQAKKLITNYLLGAKIVEDKVRGVFERFIGAYPYYVLIAWRNKIKDVFDKRVVEAYWVGNSLLKTIQRYDVGRLIFAAFVLPGFMDLGKARALVKNLPQGVLPHHSFHVLFMGSVTETVEIKGKAIDLCRIAWGRVREVDSGKLKVRYKPLLLEPKFALGEEREKVISFEPNFGPKVKAGDWVSFHWDFLCDKLGKTQVENLEKCTLLTLKNYGQFKK